MGDLNTLVDKLHSDSDIDDIQRECNNLAAKNKRESEVLDSYFLQKQQ